MSSTDGLTGDPLEFLRRMWGNMGFGLPGMMTPTLDVDELDKRIADLRAVEGWLKMNLSMLQMTIQGLEVQRATLSAMRAMGQPSEGEAGAEGTVNPFANPALWTWPFAGMAGARAGDDTPPPDAPATDTPPPKPARKGSRKT